VDDAQLVGSLGRLGLTGYEAKAYMALIRRDSFTAAQLARQAGLPRQRIYDVLGRLVERGLAAARPGRVVQFAATPPDVAIETLLAAQREELARLEIDAHTLADGLRPAFDAGRTQTDPVDYVEVLRDRHVIAARTTALLATARDEVLMFVKSPEAPSQRTKRRARSRSVVRRSVYELAALDDAVFASILERRAADGEQQRFVASLPLALTVIDEKVVVLGLANAAFVVGDHPLAAVIKAAFEVTWQTGLARDAARNTQRTEA
jgi:sugar-specific transcriptional regulator TrmB